MTFDPSRVPVKRNLPGTANAYLKTGDFVDLRETLAYLLREMAEPFGSHSADHYRKLADKIAAASGEQGSGAAPPRRATPATPLEAEIAGVTERALDMQEQLIGQLRERAEKAERELAEARAAIRFLDEGKFPYRMSSVHATAVAAAYREGP